MSVKTAAPAPQRRRVRHRAAVRGFALALTVALLAGCAMPRGAALQGEVLRGTADPQSGFQVVEVTRAALADLGRWPQATGFRHHGWPSTGASPVARTIRAGDLLGITVWDSQSDSLLTNGEQRAVTMQDVPVSSSGQVFVPYVGEMRLAGMTVEQARREVQAQLGAIVPDGQVQLALTSGASNTIDVVTGVARPGRVQMPEISPTILSVLAESGGIAPSLRNPVVRLNRAGVAYAIAARDLFGNPAHDIQLRGGDRILVEEDQRSFTVMGATGEQQVVQFERDRITALEAISGSGGLSVARANLQGVLVLRTYPAEAIRPSGAAPQQPEVIFTLDLSSADGLFAAQQFLIQPGDVVLATESPVPLFGQAVTLLRTLRNVYL